MASTRGTRKRIVLHAGLPKTGTTYLQRRFVDNRDWLAAHGVAYPVVGQEFLFGHHNVAFALGDRRPQGTTWESVDTALQHILASDLPCILLSSENFSELPLDRAGPLRDALAGHDLEYVVVVRRRSALCASRWQTEVKHGSTRTFPAFLADELVGTGRSTLRIEDSLLLAIDTHGLDVLRIVVLDNLLAAGVDLFDYFVQTVLGLPTAGSVAGSSPRENVALSPPSIEILRALNGSDALDSRCTGVALHQATASFLKSDPVGQALRHEVTALFDVEGRDLDLGLIDWQWLGRDAEIMRTCRSNVFNPAGEQRLFADLPPTVVRVLEPHRLYRRIPCERFDDVYRRILERALAG